MSYLCVEIVTLSVPILKFSPEVLDTPYPCVEIVTDGYLRL
jgi:hypothetical protein